MIYKWLRKELTIYSKTVKKRNVVALVENTELSEFNAKADRWDKLSNECIRCLSTRNKRRCDPNFRFPDYVQTREEVEEYLKNCRYKTSRRIDEQKIEKKEKSEKENENYRA